MPYNRSSEREFLRYCPLRMSLTANRPGRYRQNAAAGLTLLLLLLGPASATALASGGARLSSGTKADYRSLYLGLDTGGRSQPPLRADTSINLLEKSFPVPSVARVRRQLEGLGPELYLGVTLARLSCNEEYVSEVDYGPGRVLTLTVVEVALASGVACPEFIGPVRYQVLALPLSQFPHHARLVVLVRRPAGISPDQVSVCVP